MDNHWINQFISRQKDFPKSGVIFQWYGALLRDPSAFREVMEVFIKRYQDKKAEVVLGLESRGFIFGSILAYELSLPFVLVRKCGRLPEPTFTMKFEHEYGMDCFEMEQSALNPGQKILIIDDLLATGGSMEAACRLAKRAQADILEAASMLEITSLKGRSRLSEPYFSLFQV